MSIFKFIIFCLKQFFENELNNKTANITDS